MSDTLSWIADQEKERKPVLNPKTADLVKRFSEALAEKLLVAQEKYGHSDEWMHPNWETSCREQMMEHIKKGDPRDVAAYCAFMWHHGWSTAKKSNASSKFAMYEDDARELIERIKDDLPVSPKMAKIISAHALNIMRENAGERKP